MLFQAFPCTKVNPEDVRTQTSLPIRAARSEGCEVCFVAAGPDQSPQRTHRPGFTINTHGLYGRSNRLRDDIIFSDESMKSREKADIIELDEVRKLEEMLQAFERHPNVV
jgi:hypothetical protein